MLQKHYDYLRELVVNDYIETLDDCSNFYDNEDFELWYSNILELSLYFKIDLSALDDYWGVDEGFKQLVNNYYVKSRIHKQSRKDS